MSTMFERGGGNLFGGRRRDSMLPTSNGVLVNRGSTGLGRTIFVVWEGFGLLIREGER